MEMGLSGCLSISSRKKDREKYELLTRQVYNISFFVVLEFCWSYFVLKIACSMFFLFCFGK